MTEPLPPYGHCPGGCGVVCAHGQAWRADEERRAAYPHPFVRGAIYQGYFCEATLPAGDLCGDHPFAREHYDVKDGVVVGIREAAPLPPAARVYVQWKGTDVCLDFTCECGAAPHIDQEMFAYYIRCPDCGAVYVMPCEMPLRRATAAELARGVSAIDAMETCVEEDDDAPAPRLTFGVQRDPILVDPPPCETPGEDQVKGWG